MSVEVKLWESHAQGNAIRMADKLFKTFVEGLEASVPLLPSNNPRYRSELFDIFLNGFLGSVVMIAGSYSTEISKEFEEAILSNLRIKFNELRMIGLGQKREMARTSVSKSEEIE